MSQEIPEDLSAQETSGIWQKMKKEWIVFAGVILSPPVVALGLVTLVLIFLRLTTPTGVRLPPAIDAAVTLIISIFSGVIGALISERWNKARETSILVTRGKSAIRGLQLLLRNIAGIEQRIVRYATELDKCMDEPGLTSSIVHLSYEEIKTRCVELQEETLNAVEEWQDIIPEVANLKTQIGLISELKNERVRLIEEISRLKDLVNEAQQQPSTDQEQWKTLLAWLKKKEQELERVTQRLKREGTTLSNSIMASSSPTAIYASELMPSASSIGSIGSYVPANLFKMCLHCGEDLPSSGTLVTGNMKCPKCGRNPIG